MTKGPQEAVNNVKELVKTTVQVLSDLIGIMLDQMPSSMAIDTSKYLLKYSSRPLECARCMRRPIPAAMPYFR